MAELLQVVEPTEKSYDIRLTESEISAILFLTDFTAKDAKILYNSYAGSRGYTVFKPDFTKLVEGIQEAILESNSAGYTHAQDYME